MINRIINHFSWTEWSVIGEQHDSYKRKHYEIFKKTNKNGLNKYKRVLMAKSACHESEARVIRTVL